jgi:hypothetical protein
MASPSEGGTALPQRVVQWSLCFAGSLDEIDKVQDDL